jgi:hypothetical protein
MVRLDRRALVWINVIQNPTAEWIARQLTKAFSWDEAPSYLIREVTLPRIRAMGIRDKPIAPAAPWQNDFAERLIGSIRRECLNHVIVLGEAHLRRILQSYADYYRTHRSLDKDALRVPSGSAGRQHRVTSYLRRTSSPLCADLGSRYTHDGDVRVSPEQCHTC